MTKYLLFFTLGLGCRSGSTTSEGTVVGNPGDGAMRVGDGVDFQPETARSTVSTMLWKHCDGEEREVSMGVDVDLLGENQFDVPSGNWCAVVVYFSDSLFIAGPLVIEDEDEDEREEEGADDFWFEMELNTEKAIFIPESDGYTSSDEHLVMEFGEPGWFDPVELLDGIEFSEAQRQDLEEGIFVVDEEHAAYLDLVDRLESASSIFVDSDGDGQISEDERDEGPVANGDPDAVQDVLDDNNKDKKKPSAGSGGCGGSSAWFLMPLGWVTRRRLLRGR